MKKIIMALALLLAASSVYAMLLPEGSQANVSDVSLTDGKISSVTLMDNAEINTPFGKLQATGTITFNSDGSVESFTPVKSGSFETPAGTFSYAGQEDSSYTTPALEFYPGGSLKKITLSAETKLVTKAGTLTAQAAPVEFYDQYAAKSFKPKNNFYITIAAGKFKVSKDDFVEFYPSGKFKAFTIEGPASLTTDMGTISIIGKAKVSTYENKKIESITVDSVQALKYSDNHIYTAPDSTVYFYSSGKLKEVTAINNEFILGQFKVTNVVKETKVKFYESGSLIVSTCYINFDNYKIYCGDDIIFFNPQAPERIFASVLAYDYYGSYNDEAAYCYKVTALTKKDGEVITKTFNTPVKVPGSKEAAYAREPFLLNENSHKIEKVYTYKYVTQKKWQDNSLVDYSVLEEAGYMEFDEDKAEAESPDTNWGR